MQTAFERIIATFAHKPFHLHRELQSAYASEADDDSEKIAGELLQNFQSHLAQRVQRPD